MPSFGKRLRLAGSLDVKSRIWVRCFLGSLDGVLPALWGWAPPERSVESEVDRVSEVDVVEAEGGVVVLVGGGGGTGVRVEEHRFVLFNEVDADVGGLVEVDAGDMNSSRSVEEDSEGWVAGVGVC